MSTSPYFCVFKSKSPNVRVRLYCFTSAGSGASGYFRLSTVVAPDVQVIGREGRLNEKPIGDYKIAIKEIGQAIKENQEASPIPYALLGISLGTVLSFEVIKRFKEDGTPLPFHYFACSSSHPCTRTTVPYRISEITDDKEFLIALQKIVKNEKLNLVIENPDLRSMVVPSLRGDTKIGESYIWSGNSVPLSLPMTVVYGSKDNVIDISKMDLWKQESERCEIVALENAGHLLNEEQTFLEYISNRLK